LYSDTRTGPLLLLAHLAPLLGALLLLLTHVAVGARLRLLLGARGPAAAAWRWPVDATLGAVKLRLRPIIMTSLAFIFGMVPLVISTGAGAASRIAVGTGVMGGMIAATLLGVFFIPLFYLSVRRWINRA
jgi:hypothetical protein